MKYAYLAPFALTITSLTAAPLGALPVAPSQTHWECVPIARALSGIQIRGDAHTWWGQAEGRYRKGNQPRRGAVLAFKPHGAMELGHVAAVSRIIDNRSILVTHSNWSRIDGRRGQIEKDVRIIDVSPANDWSRVRVWFAPMGDLGTTEWPVHGFIYPGGAPPMRLPGGASPAPITTQSTRALQIVPTRQKSAAPRLMYRDLPEEQMETRGSGLLDGMAKSFDHAAARELAMRGQR